MADPVGGDLDGFWAERRSVQVESAEKSLMLCRARMMGDRDAWTEILDGKAEDPAKFTGHGNDIVEQLIVGSVEACTGMR